MSKQDPSTSSPNGNGIDVEVEQSSSASSPTRRSRSTKSTCLLIVIGALLLCSMVISLSIGHYHHIQHGILSITSSSSLQSRLQEFLGEGTHGNSRENEPQDSPPIKSDGIIDIDERAAFESIIKRVRRTQEQCNNIPSDQRHTVKKELKPATDLPMLPEGGVASALEKWLKENPQSDAKSDEDYPTCYIPPPKSCHLTTYTLIIMSHTTERLQAFMDPLSSMVSTWPGLTEVVIVWNSPRETLTDVVNSQENSKEKMYASQLLEWDNDTSHPLRIFFSLENGLENNLLNRYHPKLKPKNEAVMYFDDDGPFWSREAMIYGGFELWKRNSNVQVGGFPRNIRFLSSRMKGLEKTNLQASIDLVNRDVHGYDGESHPTFTPICRNVTGDHVEYNYFTFPDFAGHVLLPSGTILHRNFLCFIWHPAFEELRQWVVTHKTMPDDMTVSTLISHLSGRAPRTFPREVDVGGTNRRLSAEDMVQSTPVQQHNERNNIRHLHLQSPHPDESHRRLLWKQKGWGGMREEAINSILGYFGSIHPGTVGWCAGTQYMRPNSRGVPFVCHPEKPTLNLVPWLIEGAIGSKQCPFDPNLIPNEVFIKKEEEPKIIEFDDFCATCKYKGSFPCQARMDFLIDKYNNSPVEAKEAVIKEDANCRKKR